MTPRERSEALKSYSTLELLREARDRLIQVNLGFGKTESITVAMNKVVDAVLTLDPNGSEEV